MGRIISPNRREIASKRLRFLFYEIVPIFIVIFIIQILEWTILPLIVDQSSALFGVSFNFIRALMIFSVVILLFYIYNRFKKKNLNISKEGLALHIGFLRLYNLTKKNYIYQLLYSVLLFFLILIPLEFLLIICLPQTVSLSAVSQVFKTENSFLLLDNFMLFLFSASVIQFSISFSEETIFRGFVAKRGSEHFNKLSAVMISTVYFSFYEVFLNPVVFTVSYYFGVIWFLKSFLIGLVLSLTIIRRKWLFPLIIAKTFDSIISIIIIWEFLQIGNISHLLIFIYSPLLIISLILFILQRSRIKESLQIGAKMVKSYFRNDIKLKESSSDTIFRILFDIILALLIFLFGFLISV